MPGVFTIPSSTSEFPARTRLLPKGTDFKYPGRGIHGYARAPARQYYPCRETGLPPGLVPPKTHKWEGGGGKKGHGDLGFFLLHLRCHSGLVTYWWMYAWSSRRQWLAHLLCHFLLQSRWLYTASQQEMMAIPCKHCQIDHLTSECAVTPVLPKTIQDPTAPPVKERLATKEKHPSPLSRQQLICTLRNSCSWEV